MPLYTHDQLFQQFNKALDAVYYPANPAELYEPINYALSVGGKRLRPVFMLLACQAFGGDVERTMAAAIALETFHNYTLLHDDLMDNADVRRGKPTVHKRWDANVAILSGDAMLELAYGRMYQALSQADGIAETARQSAFRLFLETTLQVSEGQQYDMNFEHRLDVTLNEYFEMIRLKTGVLIACALEMGALVGGATREQADKLYQYGLQIGSAFQLQDDYLDVFGDAKVFGKSIGGDIHEGKKTYLLISALSRSSAEQRLEIADRLTDHDADPQAKIDWFTQLYKSLGVPEACAQEMLSCYYEADKLLASVKMDDTGRQLIKDFADSLVHRVL